jgi:ArsR family transcriptional regulator
VLIAVIATWIDDDLWRAGAINALHGHTCHNAPWCGLVAGRLSRRSGHRACDQGHDGQKGEQDSHDPVSIDKLSRPVIRYARLDSRPARAARESNSRGGRLDLIRYFHNLRRMDINAAIKRLSALAQESRLPVFRFLIRAGPGGVSAGEIARTLQITPNTLSAQLNILTNAGLVTSRREGRSIIYAADFDGMSELLIYLMEDCCQGRPEICAPLAQAASRAACFDQPQAS